MRQILGWKAKFAFALNHCNMQQKVMTRHRVRAELNQCLVYSPTYKALSRLITYINCDNIREWDGSLYVVQKKRKTAVFLEVETEILSCIHCDCQAQAYHYSDNNKGETGQDIRSPRLWNMLRDKAPEWWWHNNLYLQEQIWSNLNSMFNAAVDKQKQWHENSVSPFLSISVVEILE